MALRRQVQNRSRPVRLKYRVHCGSIADISPNKFIFCIVRYRIKRPQICGVGKFIDIDDFDVLGANQQPTNG